MKGYLNFDPSVPVSNSSERCDVAGWCNLVTTSSRRLASEDAPCRRCGDLDDGCGNIFCDLPAPT